MIFGPDSQPLYFGVARRSLGDCPALQHTIDLQPQIPVKPGGVMFLDDEEIATRATASLAGRFGRFREVAFRVIFGKEVLRLTHDLGRFLALRRSLFGRIPINRFL